MAWSGSALFQAFFEDAMENTAALDIDTDTIKSALFDNTGTPSKTVTSANTAYGAGVYATGGVFDASGWPAVGRNITVTTSAASAGTYTYDASDLSSANSTTSLTNATGTLIYDDTLTTPVADQGICYLYFGGSNTVVSGTFTIVWNASGLFTLAV